MARNKKEPFYADDTDEFLGFIVEGLTSWQVETIFGYTIALVGSRKEAEFTLYQEGTEYLKGIWQYYDKDDQDWFPCVIKKAYEQQVIVNRTNNLGFQDKDDYKQVIIDDPSENNLIKSA